MCVCDPGMCTVLELKDKWGEGGEGRRGLDEEGMRRCAGL